MQYSPVAIRPTIESPPHGQNKMRGAAIEFMEIENNGATLVLTKHGAHFEHENGFILQDSTKNLVFKHPPVKNI